MKENAGYSVIEVLVAFAIMALTLAVLLPGQANLGARAAIAHEETLAYDFALSRIEHYRARYSTPIGERNSNAGTWTSREVVTITSPTVGLQRLQVLVEVYNENGRLLASELALLPPPENG